MRRVTRKASPLCQTALHRLALVPLMFCGVGLSSVAFASDIDQDGIDDWLDNCTDRFNPQQLDADGDRYGDLCDGDLDNDGQVTTVDLRKPSSAPRGIAKGRPPKR